MEIRTSGIVLAAGRGERMQSLVPKQYMPLCGKPMIYYALRAFEESSVDEVILVVAAGEEEYCLKEIVSRYSMTKVTAIVPGGKERADSVLSGIRAARGTYVLIHDGARAFVTPALIDRMAAAASQYDAAVAAVPEKNTIRTVDPEGFSVSTPDRCTLREMQTPQAFRREVLLRAYEKLAKDGTDLSLMTDDAMIAERGAGARIRLIDGEYTNLKVTTPEDLLFGEAILRKRGENKTSS